MLDFSRPPRQIAGLTVFADHADAHVHYVTSAIPALVRRDDMPLLQLALFRGNQEGALLSFETQLAATEAQIEAVKNELVTNRELILLEPPWRAGTMQLAGWLQTDELKPLRIELTPPSLMGAPRAIAAARLDRNAAALALAALEGGMLPTVVIFDLEMLALGGPLGVRVEADLQALHDRLTAKGALQTPIGRAQIQSTWEEALRDNVIKVEIVDESFDFESSRGEAMRRLGEELIAKMFSPYPPPERPPLLDDEAVAAIELSFRLTMRREELDTHAKWSFVERQAVTLRHYAAASLIDMLDEGTAARHISTVDLLDTTREILIRTEPELAALGMAAVEVDLRWSDEEHADATYVLTDEQPEALQTVGVDWNTPLFYRVRSRYDPTETDAPDQESEWYSTTGGFVRVSPRRLFPPRSLTVILGRGELDWLDHVKVLVHLSDERTKSIVMGETRRNADLFLPGVGDDPLKLTVNWEGDAQEPSNSVQLQDVDRDLIVLDSPFGNSISVFVVPRLLSDVISLVLEMEYTDGDFRQSHNLEWVPEDPEPRTVHMRRFAGSPRNYRYRTFAMHDSGDVEESDWIDTEKTQLIPGASEPLQVHNVAAILLGGGVAGRGAFAAEIVLSAGEHETRRVMDQEQERADLVLLVPRDSPDPVVVVTEFLNIGGTRETRFEEPGQMIVVPPPPVIADPVVD